MATTRSGVEKGTTPDTDSMMERPVSRFVVGIDLGTSNCAVAFVDTQKPDPIVQLFKVPQWVDWQTVESRDTLPSFHYQLTDVERSSEIDATAGQWVQDQSTVGAWARDRGGQLPGRQIASAKSWLCHDGVDRTSPILPWHGDADVQKLSPVRASASYLAHIRLAWDRFHKTQPLADQDVVITLPASFDEIARELTLEAARQAGLPRVILIEEPQAAFYAWLDRNRSSWFSQVKPGQSILVCDIGGGTTDFTLIRVRQASAKTESLVDDRPDQPVSLHRVAVGQHLILGGDNLDLALAKHVERKLVDKGQLPARQWDALRNQCRSAKEVLLGENPPKEHTIHLPGTGASLLASGYQATITDEDVQQVILNGFFPNVALTERPSLGQSGFFEFGLPYAADPAVTKHLAAFLVDHAWAGRDEREQSQLSLEQASRPDWILFNGGVLEAAQVRESIVQAIANWFAGTSPDLSKDWRPGVLSSTRLDLAVAYGAAYFGLVKRGLGIRIDATLARSYYLAIDAGNDAEHTRAICLVPGNAQAGDRYSIESQKFQLAIGQPVEFQLLVSSIRLADEVGSLLEIDKEQIRPLPPIRTVLQWPGKRKQDLVEVKLEIELTEIGTLQVWCVTTDQSHRWRLEFDVRSSVETDRAGHQGTGEAAGIVDQSIQGAVEKVLLDVFKHGVIAPDSIWKPLRAAAQSDRSDWPPSLLRGMWNVLIDVESGRKRSAAHEARWLNLVGYCLRPGYGMAADDWRVAESWRRIHGKLAFGTPNSRTESTILWRRIAGGFTAGQQLALYQPQIARLRELLTVRGKAASSSASEATELLRLVGSLELLPLNEKEQLGNLIVGTLSDNRTEALRGPLLWSLGRIGSRTPFYGPLSCVVSADVATVWIEKLLMLGLQGNDFALALMQIARRTQDRYRDLPASSRKEVLDWLGRNQAPQHYRTLVEVGGNLENEEANHIFGESLPLGLRLLSGHG